VKFLALIIALVLLQYWGSAGPVHRDAWFRDVVGRFNSSGLGSSLGLALSVLVPSLLLLWLLDFVEGWALGLIPLGLSVLVLLYSFGRGDFEALVEQYREYCQHGDFEAAFLFAEQQLGADCTEPCPSGAEELHRWVKARICYLGFERWFGVMFYFLLLGAPGALAYRLLRLYGDNCEEGAQLDTLRRVQYYVDWVPARLLVFAFAVTGDWVGSREQLTTSLSDTKSSTGDMLADGAHAALGLKSTVFSSDNGDKEAFAEVSSWEISQLQSLLSRSAVAWVVVLALLVLLL